MPDTCIVAIAVTHNIAGTPDASDRIHLDFHVGDAVDLLTALV